MAYNSYLYLFVFLGACVLLYYVMPKRARYLVLLLFSLSFYMTFSKKMLLFLLATTLWVFLLALLIEKVQTDGRRRTAQLDKAEKQVWKRRIRFRKKLVLAVSLTGIFGLLIFLKYYNFFAVNVDKLRPGLLPSLKLMIPLGISFYTLMAAGYLVDVYRGKYGACRNILHFLLFLNFFPQIMEGPVGRYDRLHDQLVTGHSFDSARFVQGVRRITYGLLLKMVIADRAAIVVNKVFNDYTSYSGVPVVFAILLYTLELYAEFMGCMEMVSGSAQLFGIELDANFRQPFASASVNEFWQRWHMTLGSWIRDYIFYPASLSKPLKRLSKRIGSRLPAYYKKITPVCIALFFVWLFNGFWHGSSWHYIFYGLYYYGCMLLGMLLEPLSARLASKLHISRGSRAFHGWRVVRTFLLVNIGMLIFRGNGLRAAIHMFLSIFSGFRVAALYDGSLLKLGCDMKDFWVLLAGVVLLWIGGRMRERGRPFFERLDGTPRSVRWAVYYAIFFIVLIFGAYGQGYVPVDFIYAQF